MTVQVGLTPPPADIVAIARRVMQGAMELDEDANNCAGNPVPCNFDNMLTSMLKMRDTLTRAFAEIVG